MFKGLGTVGAAIALAAIVMLSTGGSVPQTKANPSNLTLDFSVPIGSSSDITFRVNDEDADPGNIGGGQVDLSGDADPGVGYFSTGNISDSDGNECAAPVGIGTDQLTWPTDCPENLDPGADDTFTETLFGTAEWLCVEVGTVQLTLSQNSVDLTGPSYVINCVAPVSTPVRLTLQSDPEEEVTTCPSAVRITARVVDINGSPLPDGIIVTFTANGGRLTSGFGTTINGFTETTLEVSGNLPPEITVLATATVQNVSFQDTITLEIKCGSFGPPDEITFILSSPTVECGKSIFVGGRVIDDDGRLVADGTPVELIATNGTLEAAKTTTLGGVFTVTYTAPASALVDTITASAKGLFGSTTITVTCGGVTPGATPTPGAGGTAAGATTAGGAAGAAGAAGGTGAAGAAGATGNGTIRPPSTGDGGLRDGSGSGVAGGLVALIAMALAGVVLRRAV